MTLEKAPRFWLIYIFTAERRKTKKERKKVAIMVAIAEPGGGGGWSRLKPRKKVKFFLKKLVRAV